MDTTRARRARRGLALVAVVSALSLLAGAQASVAKTTKKAAKAKTTRARASATTSKPKATPSAPADAGPAKNIVGTEVGPGDPIKIGVIGSAPSEFGGDVPRMFEIAFDVLRKAGELPVHGRDVVLYFRDRGTSAATLRAACTANAQDDKVFAALVWAVNSECLAGDYKIPTIGGGLSDEEMARTWPYAFSTVQSANAHVANLPHWADSLGRLKGRKIGIYHNGDTPSAQQVDREFKPQLRKLGYTAMESLGGSDDAAHRVAVQRFKVAGVNTIFMMSTFPGEFAKAAVSQGYKPEFLIGGPLSPVYDGAAATRGMTKDSYGGSYAYAASRVGENGLLGNPAPIPEAVECARNYERFSGERVRQDGTFAESTRWQSVQWSCVEARIVIDALKAVGPKLTQGAYINALETQTKSAKSGLFPDITFSRTNHFGSNQFKTLQLDGDCLCWKQRSAFRSLFVNP